MAQPVRFATLEKFKAGELRLLCCSDVAARGIDIGGLSHVFNFDVPIHAEDFVHRIGRTGRAGREGRAFMLATPDDRLAVQAIEKLTGFPINRIQIDGLDTVEWAEGDRRGRGRKPKAKTPEKSVETAKAEPRAKAPPKPRKSAPPVVAVALDPAEAPQPVVARSHLPPRQDERRDQRPRRDDDLGTAVVGFGADVPAFMLIPARRRPAPDLVAEFPDSAP